jgi:3-phenylpropionate/trans-cinnamate dioxygenase ferredoxin reductase component
VSPTRVTIVGGGVASAAAVTALRADGFNGGITLVSAEETVPYERPPLSKEYLLGAVADVTVVRDEAWYARHDVDVLVIGVGTVPNAELAAAAGLPTDGGIAVDEYFTAAPGVYAAGDVAAQYLPQYGRRVRAEHHDTAARHGRAAARSMLGQREPFSDVHWFWSDQYQHSIQSAGLPDGPQDAIIRGSLNERSFSAFSLEHGRVRAVISLNRPQDVIETRRLIAREHSVTAAQLRDESIPVKWLAAPARSVTAT